MSTSTETTNLAALSGAEIVELTGISLRRLQQLAQEGRVPKPVVGRWDGPAVVQALIQRQSKAQAPDGASYGESRARREAARARREEVEADLAEGKVVNVEEVKRLVARRFTESRNMVYAACGTAAMKVVGKVPPESKEIMQREIDHAYEQIQKLRIEGRPQAGTAAVTDHPPVTRSKPRAKRRRKA